VGEPLMTVQAVYTLDELSKLWKVKVTTVYRWLAYERHAGRAPATTESCTKRVNGKKATILRADYARKIQDRYVFRALRRRRPGATNRAVEPRS